MLDSNEQAHRVRTRRLTIAALALWAVCSVLIHLIVVALNTVTVPMLGFPLGFYMSAQGSLIALVALLFWHARHQDRIDREHGVAEDA